MSKLEEIKSKIENLPPDAIQDLETFVDFLIKRGTGDSGKLKQDWAGGLKRLKDNYTSLQLQKKALEWRKG